MESALAVVVGDDVGEIEVELWFGVALPCFGACGICGGAEAELDGVGREVVDDDDGVVVPGVAEDRGRRGGAWGGR